MKRVFKALTIVVATVVTIIIIAAVAVYGFSEARYRRQYAVALRAVTVRADSAAIARGAHLAQSFGGCADCHGQNMGGKVMIDDAALGRVYGTNLTRGKGGVGASLTAADIVRALTHGVGRDGRPLKVMPASDYVHLNDADLAALVAYVQSVPPVDATFPPSRIGPLGRALFVAGKFPIIQAERVDHGAAPIAPVAAGPTAEYGAYVASVGCKGCHGQTLAGGPIEGGAPDWPPATNLTRSGPTAKWTEAAFSQLLRTGKRPDGSQVNEVMPVHLTKNLSDDEVRALWLYLRSVPPTPAPASQTASR